MQLSSADDTIYFLEIHVFFAHKTLKKTPSKINIHFFTYCLSFPNGPNRRIIVPKASAFSSKSTYFYARSSYWKIVKRKGFTFTK